MIRTSRWDRQADGSWVISTTEVPGLTSDQQVISSTTIYRHGYSEMAVSPSVSTAMGQGAASFPGSSLERAINIARSGVWWISPDAFAALGELEFEPEVYFFDTDQQRIVSGVEHVA